MVEILLIVLLISTQLLRDGTFILTCRLILNKQKKICTPELLASPRSMLRLIPQECLSGSWTHSILSVAAHPAVMD